MTAHLGAAITGYGQACAGRYRIDPARSGIARRDKDVCLRRFLEVATSPISPAPERRPGTGGRRSAG
jgi:hypothetical protein